MNDLATWLLEQIAEDERRAQDAAEQAGRPDWHAALGGEGVRAHGHDATYLPGKTIAAGGDGFLIHEFGDHIATWDPARVLAECDAKRRRVAWHQPAEPSIGPDDPRCKTCAVWAQWPHVEAGPLPYPCPSLRLEALPYADRDGYREEWRS